MTCTVFWTIASIRCLPTNEANVGEHVGWTMNAGARASFFDVATTFRLSADHFVTIVSVVGTECRHARAHFLSIAFTCGHPTDFMSVLEHVHWTGLVYTIAHLWDVTRACTCSTHHCIRLHVVRGTGGAATRAGVGDIAYISGKMTDDRCIGELVAWTVV